MKFDLTLTVQHPDLDEPKVHNHGVCAASLNHLLKQLKLSNKQVCDIKSYGVTHWEDDAGGFHKFEVKQEA